MVLGTDNRDKGTDDAVKGTDNRDKGTDDAVKGTDNRDKGLMMLLRVLIIVIRAGMTMPSVLIALGAA